MLFKNKSFFFLLFITFFCSYNQKIFASDLLFLQAEKNEHHHHNSMGEMNEDKTHHHQMMAIPEGEPVPTVDLVVHEDAVEGWNLEIKATNFDFDPNTVNKNSDYKKGHGHIYINGKKLTRVYSNWFYLQTLPVGNNEIKVTLNTNKHEDLTYQGQVISDVETVIVGP